VKTHKSLVTPGSALALVLYGTAATPLAPAQQAAGGDTAAAFKSMDKNHDGRLARSEIPDDMVFASPPASATRTATWTRRSPPPPRWP
jgi:hypothetical protein